MKDKTIVLRIIDVLSKTKSVRNEMKLDVVDKDEGIFPSSFINALLFVFKNLFLSTWV